MGRAVVFFLLVAIVGISIAHSHKPKCKDGSFYPHEKTCKHFYRCSKGNLVLQTCPGKLEFNPKKKTCDWPSNFKCKLSGGGGGGGSSSSSSSSESDESVEVPYPTPTASPPFDPNRPCSYVSAPICPEHEAHKPAVHLAHQSDCRLFYKCDWGEAYLHECPGGLHYNSRLQVCDWPEKAGCAC